MEKYRFGPEDKVIYQGLPAVVVGIHPHDGLFWKYDVLLDACPYKIIPDIWQSDLCRGC